MLLDKQTLFSDAQTLVITTAASPKISDNVIDLWGKAALDAGPLGTPVFDPGRGEDLELFIQILVAYGSSGASNLQVKVVNADSADLTSNPVVLYDSGAIAKATLVSGYQFRIGKLPAGGVLKRYLGVTYTVTTTDGNAGTITAGIVADRSNPPGIFV